VIPFRWTPEPVDPAQGGVSPVAGGQADGGSVSGGSGAGGVTTVDPFRWILRRSSCDRPIGCVDRSVDPVPVDPAPVGCENRSVDLLRSIPAPVDVSTVSGGPGAGGSGSGRSGTVGVTPKRSRLRGYGFRWNPARWMRPTSRGTPGAGGCSHSGSVDPIGRYATPVGPLPVDTAQVGVTTVPTHAESAFR